MRYTEAPQRRAELLRRVTQAGYVSSAAAAAELGVSEMTIRRDLQALAAEGAVARVAGGASVARGTPFEQRRGAATAEKAAVARLAAGELAAASTIALDAGTTVAALPELVGPGRTIVSHSVPVIVACTARDDLDLIALGGTYHPPTRSFTGPITRGDLAQLSVDVAVLSATAAGPAGVYSANAGDAEIKQAMAAIAARVILVLDHGKLGARAPMRFMGLADADTVVIDAGVPPAQLAMLREHCARVLVADLLEGTA